jgi:hypothetical protein
MCDVVVKKIKKLMPHTKPYFRVELEFDYTDMSQGDYGEYPEFEPVIYCYLSGDISPAQNHVLVDTKRAAGKKKDGNSVFCGVHVGPMEAARSDTGGAARGVSPGSCRGASICFSVFARTRLSDADRPDVVFESSGVFMVPVGDADLDVVDVLRAGSPGGASTTGTSMLLVKDSSNNGAVKGVISFRRILMELTKDVELAVTGQKGGAPRAEVPCTGYYTAVSAELMEGLTAQFFRTFRRTLSPSRDSLLTFQVPFFTARAASVPAAFFFYYDPLAPGAKKLEAGQARHLRACLDAAMGMNNTTEGFFLSAVEAQLARRDGVVNDSFYVAVKVAFDAFCVFANRVRYLTDHATYPVLGVEVDGADEYRPGCSKAPRRPGSTHTYVSGSGKGGRQQGVPRGREYAVEKVERFLDCTRTMAGDCEDVARLIYVTSVVVRNAGSEFFETRDPAVMAWSAIANIYVPFAAVVDASLAKMGKSGGADTEDICHVCVFQVPRVAARDMINSCARGSGVQGLTPLRECSMLPAHRRDPHARGGADPYRVPLDAAGWESALDTCTLEGTMPTAPLQKPLECYMSQEYSRWAQACMHAHASAEGSRRSLEALPGSPHSAVGRGDWALRNPFKCLDVEVTQSGIFGLGDPSSIPDREFSSFYKEIVHAWCPIVATEGWLGPDPTGITPLTFADFAVCNKGGGGRPPPTYGVPFRAWTCSPSEGVCLVPSYAVGAEEMSFIKSVLSKELEPCIPSLSAAPGKPPAWSNSTSKAVYEKIKELGARWPAPVGQGAPSPDGTRTGACPPMALFRGYVAYRLDPGEITETLYGWLKHVLHRGVCGFRATSIKMYRLSDHVHVAELRLYTGVSV